MIFYSVRTHSVNISNTYAVPDQTEQPLVGISNVLGGLPPVLLWLFLVEIN